MVGRSWVSLQGWRRIFSDEPCPDLWADPISVGNTFS